MIFRSSLGKVWLCLVWSCWDVCNRFLVASKRPITNMVKKDSLKISENYWENTHENKGKEDLNYKKICTRSHMSRICTVITVWYGRVKPYYESMGDLTFHLQLSTLLILNSTAGDSWEFSEHLLHHKSID